MIRFAIDGREARCFPVEDGSWAVLQAIIVDYQAFHLWAPHMERRLQLALDDNTKLQEQKSALQTALDLASRGMEFNRTMYLEERDQRLQTNTKHDVKLYLLGGTNILTLIGLAAVTTYAAIR